MKTLLAMYSLRCHGYRGVNNHDMAPGHFPLPIKSKDMSQDMRAAGYGTRGILRNRACWLFPVTRGWAYGLAKRGLYVVVRG